MVRKKVDGRVRTLVENGVKLRHRSLFIIVGDKGKDQVVNLHYMLSKASVKARPSVLWCYKDALGFTSHRKKRMNKIKRDIQRGLRQPDQEDPFELFIGCTDIRYTYYKDTHKVLGNTYGMCVLQDFEALTPNLLARTVETVEGGGVVVLLLKTMTSLKQLYSLTMDVHSRFRTEAHNEVVARFNERFLLSLGLCKQCLVLDDELNVLPISSHINSIKKVGGARGDGGQDGLSEQDAELKDLQQTMADTQPVGALVGATRTLDQAKAVLTFVEAVSEKTLRTTVVLTAARGRGKSAALGISVAGAVGYGYSNIFVTAPSPENLKTLFEMIFKGFDAMDYKEHQDYEIVQSTNPLFNKAVVRVNIFRGHRQTIQYIQPQDHVRLAQAELLVIDEAAAIPLPMVKKLLGPYLVFMSSTVNGYEGTGRSLSLKLVKQLRGQSTGVRGGRGQSASGGRVLREVTLQEPIRYAQGDGVEKWLNELLCLDCADHVPRITSGVPHPSQCQLYRVNRDTLFSRHKASEAFLQRMMALYVASHYKNSPDDLQLMSDAPAHRLFVLLGPVRDGGGIPDVLCVLQVALEGQISKQSVLNSLSKGKRAAGDLVPWVVSQQFQNAEFASLSGARVVRIATHPDLHKMGYGGRAMELLTAYYEGKVTNLDEGLSAAAAAAAAKERRRQKRKKEKEAAAAAAKASLGAETVAPRKGLPPLLSALSEPDPEQYGDGESSTLHWLGVSYGVTRQLYGFWRKNGFSPVYMRLTPNALTGEHTCVMIKALAGTALRTVGNKDWLDTFHSDFRKRFISLLGYQFASFPVPMALGLIKDKDGSAGAINAPKPTGHRLSWDGVQADISEFDLRRLESYARNLVDYHMILDLVPTLARLFFLERMQEVSLSHSQAAILMAIGLQHRTVSDLQRALNLESNQILAQFNKAVRKMSAHLRGLLEGSVKESLLAEGKLKGSKLASTQQARSSLQPLSQSLEAELREGQSQVDKQSAAKERAMAMGLDDASLQKYAIGGSEADWAGVQGTEGVSMKRSGASGEKDRKKSKKGQKRKGSVKGGKKSRGKVSMKKRTKQ